MMYIVHTIVASYIRPKQTNKRKVEEVLPSFIGCRLCLGIHISYMYVHHHDAHTLIKQLVTRSHYFCLFLSETIIKGNRGQPNNIGMKRTFNPINNSCSLEKLVSLDATFPHNTYIKEEFCSNS